MIAGTKFFVAITLATVKQLIVIVWRSTFIINVLKVNVQVHSFFMTKKNVLRNEVNQFGFLFIENGVQQFSFSVADHSITQQYNSAYIIASG